MNKFLLLSLLCVLLGYNSSLFLVESKQYTATKHQFEKLIPKITKYALELAHALSELDEESQLAYLNLFALIEEELIEECMKCAEYIESKKELLQIHSDLGINISSLLQFYINDIQKKIDEKKLSQKNKEEIGRKLEEKISELMNCINSIYYSTLYTRLVKRSNNGLYYMFDQNGLIPKAKRSRLLPDPKNN